MAIQFQTPLLFSVFFLLLLLSFSPVVLSDDDNCVYTVYVRTGSIIKAGTDSKISLALFESSGRGVNISNLEEFGLMGPGYNYYERGNLDIFSAKGPCIDGPICAIKLYSDGSGSHHGWYCNYVEVTLTGVHKPCSQKLFTVEQWLARDTYPYELTATVNSCSDNLYGADRSDRKKSISTI